MLVSQRQQFLFFPFFLENRFLVWFLEHEAVTSKSTEVCIDRSSIKTCPEFAPASHTFVSCKVSQKRHIRNLEKQFFLGKGLRGASALLLPLSYSICGEWGQVKQSSYLSLAVIDVSAIAEIVTNTFCCGKTKDGCGGK